MFGFPLMRRQVLVPVAKRTLEQRKNVLKLRREKDNQFFFSA